jgi:signal transduction histidine kinase
VSKADLRPVDVAIVALTLVIGQQEAWFPLGPGFSSFSGPPLALSLTSAVAALALLWRRRAPLAVCVAVNVVLASYCLVFGSPDGLSVLVPVVFSLYAVGRYADWSQLAVAFTVTGVAETVHLWRDPRPALPLGPEILFFAGQLVSGLLGRVVLRYRSDVQVLTRRAERLEVEREARAREAVVAERARIAHELHDLVGHGLSLIVLQVVGAQGALEKGQRAATDQQLAKLEATARNTLAEMRRLVAVVGDDDTALAPPPGIDEIAGLVEAVRGEGLAVELELPSSVADVPTGLGLTVYRIVQEGLTNVMRHAGSGASTRVVVTRRAGELDVDVLDTGVGRSTGDDQPGRGLAGMRERVSLYGGTLDVGSTPAGGFRVHASLPLESTPA